MKKILFDNTGIQGNDAALKEKLKNDPVVQHVFSMNEIPLRYLDISPWKIDRWLQEFRPCQECKGLSECGQKERGYFNNLVYDGILQNVITPCKYRRDELKQHEHVSRFLVNDMSSRLETVSFKYIRTDNESAEYLTVLNELIEACSENRGIYLHGTMGSGKTYLAACACNEKAKEGKKVAFINYPAFCRRMSRAVNDGEYRTEYQRLCFAEFLVIDDIGAESVTEWNRDSLLFPLLNTRYEDGLPTWFTSNCDLASLRQHFIFSGRGKQEELKSSRIIERISAMTQTLALTGEDRRKSA